MDGDFDATVDPAALEADLVAWGLVERTSGGMALTRRLRAGVARAAMHLQEQEAKGQAPAGHPLRLALEHALAEATMPAHGRLTPAHVQFLFAVELTSFPDAVRQLLESPE